MKMYKFIFTCIIGTFIAFSYVHQRIEIVKIGYNLQDNRKHLSRLVDQNTKLMYNLTKLESPGNLLASLSGENIQFAGRRAIQPNSGYRRSETVLAKAGTGDSIFIRFLDLFTPSAEARSHASERESS